MKFIDILLETKPSSIYKQISPNYTAKILDVTFSLTNPFSFIMLLYFKERVEYDKNI
jgi:hypothetical protein